MRIVLIHPNDHAGGAEIAREAVGAPACRFEQRR